MNEFGQNCRLWLPKTAKAADETVTPGGREVHYPGDPPGSSAAPGEAEPSPAGGADRCEAAVDGQSFNIISCRSQNHFHQH